MLQKKLLGILLAGSIIGFAACDLLVVDEEYNEYPTIYPPLELSELQQMNAEYQQSNNGHLCSTLNKYGFTGFSELFFVNGESPCLNREVVRIEMTNTDTLEQAAKALILKDSVYTGVRDTSGLILSAMEPLSGCVICEGPDENRANIEYKLVFEEQVLDSVTVKDTEITVFMDAEGVNRIWGNWYSGFKLPEFVNFGYEQVKQDLVGLQIDMRPYTGEEALYEVQAGDLTESVEKVYLPNENAEGKGLEMRSCWEIPILPQSGTFSGWKAYVDVNDGIMVALEPI